MAVLQQRLPDGLEPHVPEVFAAIKEYGKANGKPFAANNANDVKKYTLFILQNILDFNKDYILEGQSVSQTLYVELPQHQEILALKICAPACGSGAFLVQAARYLADILLTANAPQVVVANEDNADEHRIEATRLIVHKCLYGVDKNPLAAEMAKLSLWLLTFAKDQPFEFAVGHGIGVHATADKEHFDRAVKLETVVIPNYEVPATTQPTANGAEINPAFAKLQGLELDMKRLADVDAVTAQKHLQPLIAGYQDWIDREEKKISEPTEQLELFHDSSSAVIQKCRETPQRIEEGLALLQKNENALEAFRFMNRAMWYQRTHTIYSEKVRRGEKVDFDKEDIPKNRSWRPFQIAFVLLNLPGITLLNHSERSTSENTEERLLRAAQSVTGSQVVRLLSAPRGTNTQDRFSSESLIGVPVAPFPRWLICTKCRLLAPINSGLFEPKNDKFHPDKVRYVHSCTTQGQHPLAVPARFMTVCEHGHLDDFPWLEFVHGEKK